jgi:hypothetical protein
MEPVQHQLLIFISLVAILSAAFIAVICIVLRSKNDQLRKLAVELKIRRRQGRLGVEQRRVHLLPPCAVPEAVPALAASEPPAPEPQSAFVSAKPSRDWGQMLSVRRPAPPRRGEQSRSSETALPAGFQDGDVLRRLVRDRQKVSGLVVSIGADQSSGSGAVGAMIPSLLGPYDFAAPSGNDEYVLIYPGERGAQAQRKLSQIAEQLWDFQLGSMGNFSIQFSWGGLEVRGEPLGEALTSASERMRDTLRRRKILTMGTKPELQAGPGVETPLRRAV